MLRLPATSRSTKNDIEIGFVRASGRAGRRQQAANRRRKLRFDTRKIALPETPPRGWCASRPAYDQGRRDRDPRQRFSHPGTQRADAIDRLLELCARPWCGPCTRRATKPTFGSKQRRLEARSAAATSRRSAAPARFDD